MRRRISLLAAVFFPFFSSSLLRRLSFVCSFAQLAPRSEPGVASEEVPLPLSATSVGELLAVLVTRRVALRGPGAVGVKRTLTTHPFPAGVTLRVQPLPVIWKSLGSSPTRLTSVTSRAE